MQKNICESLIAFTMLVLSGNMLLAQVLNDDTLFLGNNPIEWVWPGDTCTLTVYIKNSIDYQGWQIPVEFHPFTNDSSLLRTSLTLNGIDSTNSVMLYEPKPWDFRAWFANNYEWDLAIQAGASGVVDFMSAQVLSPGTWDVFDMIYSIPLTATPQTVIVDSTTASWTSGGAQLDYVVVNGGLSYTTVTRPCTLSIGGHLWNDTLIIANVAGTAGSQVVVPVIMRHDDRQITSWDIPLTFGNGSVPLTCDSIKVKWSYLMADIDIDTAGQNCWFYGVGFNNPGVDSVMELYISIHDTASLQSIPIDTTSYDPGSGVKSLQVNSGYVPIVVPGVINITLIGEEEDKVENTVTLSGVFPTIVWSGAEINIRFAIPEISLTTISIFDVTGRKVSTVYQGKPEHGVIDIIYNTRDLPGGIYFIRVDSDNKSEIKKIVITR